VSCFDRPDEAGFSTSQDCRQAGNLAALEMTNVVWGALDGVVRPPGAAMLSGLVGAMALDRLALNVRMPGPYRRE